MAKNEQKDLVYYMSLPYSVVLRPDEEGDFIARIAEFPGCIAHGSTVPEALEALREIQSAWIEDCLATGDPIPEPESEEELPSGKWIQRVPRSLHAKLARRAKTEGVSLNQFVTSLLSEALASRAFLYQVEQCKALVPPNLHRWGELVSGPDEWSVSPRGNVAEMLLLTLKYGAKLLPGPGVIKDDYKPQAETAA